VAENGREGHVILAQDGFWFRNMIGSLACFSPRTGTHDMVVYIFWRGKVEATARNGSETHHGIHVVLVVDCFGSAACTSFGCVLVPQKELSDLSLES
jgi:hypothetical protein